MKTERPMKIPYLSLQDVTALHGDEIQAAVRETVASGRYLLGPQNRQFETEWAAYLGCRHAVGCANGLDALIWIFRAYIEMGVMQPGDEVLVPANTYIATFLAITENGLVPVPVEPHPDTLEIDERLVEAAITARTRALCLVHLYGRCAFTPTIAALCRRYGLKLIEDNAQAHGCRFEGRPTGSLGDAAGHSFYPGKNLGALGDGGAVTTDDDQLADVVRTLANYGSPRKYEFRYCGRNSRLDEIQAAVLRVKLRHLDSDNERRRAIARYYCEHLANPAIRLSKCLPDEQNVWHIFPILCDDRDRLQQFLAQHDIETLIHYPVPPHQQACYRDAAWARQSLPVTEQIHRQELSLPISPALSLEAATQVVEIINQF